MSTIRKHAIKQGMSRPYLAVTFEDSDGNAIDLSTATSVKFTMRAAGSSVPVIDDVSSTITAATSGRAEYRFTSTDTAIVGEYEGEFRIVWSPTDSEMHPADGYIAITVFDDLQ